MTQFFLPVPTYAKPFTEDEQTKDTRFSVEWLDYFLRQADVLRQASNPNTYIRNTGAIVTLGVTSSPFTYQNVDGFDEDIIVQGGAVSLIELSRDGLNFFNTGLTSGIVRLSPNDYIRLTYSGLPQTFKVPR